MENQTTPPDGLYAPDHVSDTPKKGSFWKEFITFIIIAVFIVLPFRWFIAEPYIVSGTSMSPTFETGHYLIVDKISYRFEKPQRFDVIVMIYPADKTQDFIKRIIGLPGETVMIKAGVVSIVEPGTTTPIVLSEPFIKYPGGIADQTVTLNADQYFVMGDNRAGSFDSRYWGPLPTQDIIGTPVVRLLPLSKIGFNPGSYEN
jgi:signal peptidase I